MSETSAILLCAGYGTRMGALTERAPKPLLPMAGRPLLDYLLDRLAGLSGLCTIHIVSNRRYFDRFRDWAADRQRPNRQLIVHDDGSTEPSNRLGAVGDLGFVLQRIAANGQPLEGALVAAGDNIPRFSLAPLWQAFLRDRRSRVLALAELEPEQLRRTGVLELADDDRVLALHEKPADPPSHWACPPIYALSSSALQRVAPYLADGLPSDEIGRFIADLVCREPVFATRTSGERLHVGSPAAYHRADEVLRLESRRDP